MVDQRGLFSLSEDELFVEIGRELDRGLVEALSSPVEALRRRGERFVQEQIQDWGIRACRRFLSSSLIQGRVA